MAEAPAAEAEERPKEPVAQVRKWLNEIGAARKREKDFRKDGERILRIYGGDKQEETPYNILYSNTETLLPALFSQTPRPVVQRRFKDEDPLGKAAAEAGQRALGFLLDTNVEGYETFQESVQAAVLDALLPGRGVTMLKYEADIVDVPQPDGSALPVKQWESVCPESRSWNRVYFGYAKKWSKVPWIAFEEHLDDDEAKEMFGEAIAGKLIYTQAEEDERDEDGEKKTNAQSEDSERKTCLVYQIWDRAGGKKIRYIAPCYNDGYVKEQDDPLGVTGFYPMPRPLRFLEKSNDLSPKAIYALYENQAKELNRITIRLKFIIEALKARGVYDSSLGEEVASVLKEDDNALVPTDKGSSLAAEGGLEKAIWMMPLDKLQQVAVTLANAREQCKQVIYEITGIADILRGSSKASETLGAQEIKERWGGLRLKRLQKEVQRYARDMLRIMMEIAVSKFSERTLAQMTGLPFSTEEQRAQAQTLVQAAAASGQQPDPQAMKILQSPAWADVLKLLKDDAARSYRIDIETNSTVELEATEDQKNIAEVMNAIAQFLNGIAPLVTSGAMPIEAAKAMLLAIVRRYRFGPEVEEQIKMMQMPKPPEDGKAAAAQAQIAADKEKHALTLQAEQARDAAQAQREREKLAVDQQSKAADSNQRAADNAAKLAHDKAIEQMKAQVMRNTEIEKARIAAAAQVEIARIKAQATESEKASNDDKSAKDQQRHEQSLAATNALIQKLLESNAQIMAAVTAESEFSVKRNPDGSLVGNKRPKATLQ
jgi:hypothetical protein